MPQHPILTLKPELDRLADTYNVESFAQDDPIVFPRSFSELEDIEISALLTSTIAWGRRSMILRDAERMHGLLNNRPYEFVMNGDIDSISDDNIHRTFFGRHLRHYLRGLRLLYSRHGSLQQLALDCGAPADAYPAEKVAKALSALLAEANAESCDADAGRCLPSKIESSALKRFNMALRWLVRNDGIVDIGCWTALTPAQLYIPLDVHSGNVARKFGLLTRKQNDAKAVKELTANLRLLAPEDPIRYDFALFGAGVNGAL